MKIHRSKTIWFSFALVVFGALFDNLPTLQAFLDPKFYSYSLVSIGICVAILRFLTTQPLEDK
jgi:hypothetical protein